MAGRALTLPVPFARPPVVVGAEVTWASMLKSGDNLLDTVTLESGANGRRHETSPPEPRPGGTTGSHYSTNRVRDTSARLHN